MELDISEVKTFRLFDLFMKRKILLSYLALRCYTLILLVYCAIKIKDASPVKETFFTQYSFKNLSKLNWIQCGIVCVQCQCIVLASYGVQIPQKVYNTMSIFTFIYPTNSTARNC